MSFIRFCRRSGRGHRVRGIFSVGTTLPRGLKPLSFLPSHRSTEVLRRPKAAAESLSRRRWCQCSRQKTISSVQRLKAPLRGALTARLKPCPDTRPGRGGDLPSTAKPRPFQSADVQSADLLSADLQGANLQSADLRRALIAARRGRVVRRPRAGVATWSWAISACGGGWER
jgi:hypothetical protein